MAKTPYIKLSSPVMRMPRSPYRIPLLQSPLVLPNNYTILYYTILYYTILYYTILYYTILYYTILYYTILYYTILYYTIPCFMEDSGCLPGFSDQAADLEGPKAVGTRRFHGAPHAPLKNSVREYGVSNPQMPTAFGIVGSRVPTLDFIPRIW